MSTEQKTKYFNVQFSCSVMSDFLQPHPMNCSMPDLPVYCQLQEFTQKLMSIESVMPANHLILCHPLLPPSIFPSIRVFSYESVFHIRWPKYWNFSFNISPSNEYSGLISYIIRWQIQRTKKFAIQGWRPPKETSEIFRNFTEEKIFQNEGKITAHHRAWPKKRKRVYDIV